MGKMEYNQCNFINNRKCLFLLSFLECFWKWFAYSIQKHFEHGKKWLTWQDYFQASKLLLNIQSEDKAMTEIIMIWSPLTIFLRVTQWFSRSIPVLLRNKTFAWCVGKRPPGQGKAQDLSHGSRELTSQECTCLNKFHLLKEKCKLLFCDMYCTDWVLWLHGVPVYPNLH